MHVPPGLIVGSMLLCRGCWPCRRGVPFSLVCGDDGLFKSRGHGAPQRHSGACLLFQFRPGGAALRAYRQSMLRFLRKPLCDARCTENVFMGTLPKLCPRKGAACVAASRESGATTVATEASAPVRQQFIFIFLFLCLPFFFAAASRKLPIPKCQILASV